MDIIVSTKARPRRERLRPGIPMGCAAVRDMKGSIGQSMNPAMLAGIPIVALK